MKVSKQVEDSVSEAISSLRNALAFAARSEEPYIAKHIADKIMELDGLIKVNQLLDDLEEIRENHTKDNLSNSSGNDPYQDEW